MNAIDWRLADKADKTTGYQELPFASQLSDASFATALIVGFCGMTPLSHGLAVQDCKHEISSVFGISASFSGHKAGSLLQGVSQSDDLDEIRAMHGNNFSDSPESVKVD